MTLFRARRVVPMHYWNPQERETFLSILRAKAETDRGSYVFENPGGPRLCLDPPRAGNGPVRIIALDPAPYPARSRF